VSNSPPLYTGLRRQEPFRNISSGYPVNARSFMLDIPARI
jgi:hypothetical protein